MVTTMKIRVRISVKVETRQSSILRVKRETPETSNVPSGRAVKRTTQKNKPNN